MKKITSLISALLITFSAFTQETRNTSFSRDNFLAEFVSRTWTAANGLPGNAITDIIQDSIGYLYLGTYDGLVRFDGVEFVTFNKNYEDKYSFVSTRTVFEDSKGNIWNGSNDEGLFRIAPDGTVTSYTNDNGLPNNSIRAIVEDKEGRIWAGTSSGVGYVDTDGNFVIPSGLEKYGAENILVTSLYCDTAGRIWILTPKENSVYIYVNKTFEKFKGLSSFKNPLITCITQDKNTNFWIGVSPHYAVKLDSDDETVFNVGHGKQAGTTVNSIFQDKKGSMWFALDTGVTIIHDNTYSYFDKSNGLSDDKVSKIMEDREGNIWFSTDHGGIERLSRSKFKTTTMSTTINAIAEDKTRNLIWFAGDDGLYCLRKNTFIENELTRFCKNIRIRDVFVDSDSSVYVSTYEKLGQVIMSSSGQIKSITKNNGLTGNKVRVSIKGSDSKIYIGTTTGLNIYDPSTGKIEKITKENGIANEYIMCIYEDSNGEIWAGTDGGGIFTLKDGIINKTITNDVTNPKSLAGNVIFKITEEKPGEYWITTGNGLSLYIPSKSEEFINYSSKNGLGSDSVFQHITDYTQTVWMTSNKGIFCASMNDMEAIAEGKNIKINSKFFGQSDGLISAGVTSTSKSMKDSLGRIWFTLIDGFAMYDPLNVTANQIAPLIKIQEITVDNEKINWQGEKVVLAPNVKRIGIKYTGLSFVSSEQTQFKSLLEGFESDYTNWTTSRYVSYTNLAPGTYNFSVIAANSDGVLSENIQEFTIIKKPYFYQRISFWLIVALIIVGAAFIIIHHRFARMRKYQIELENAVQERTKDLVAEQNRNEQLILNILPPAVAAELKDRTHDTIARKFNNVNVLFSDIVGFTKMADTLSAEEIVKMLNEITTMFDERAEREGIEKIKTMGDSYMAATGLCENPSEEDAARLIRFGRGLLEDVNKYNKTSRIQLKVRIGVNSGNVVAGVIGKTKFIYDIWGDTVNVAFRMEETGQPDLIHVTDKTFKLTNKDFAYGDIEEVDIKGKGIMKTYFTK